MQPIQASSLQQTLGSMVPRPAAGKAEQENFAQFMLGALNEVNSMQAQADTAVEQLFSGGEANAAEVLTAVQKADMSFKMLMQIRNKLVDAYQQIQDIRI